MSMVEGESEKEGGGKDAYGYGYGDGGWGREMIDQERDSECRSALMPDLSLPTKTLIMNDEVLD